PMKTDSNLISFSKLPYSAKYFQPDGGTNGWTTTFYSNDTWCGKYTIPQNQGSDYDGNNYISIFARGLDNSPIDPDEDLTTYNLSNTNPDLLHQFTIAYTPDIEYTVPSNEETDVSIDCNFEIVFTQPMDTQLDWSKIVSITPQDASLVNFSWSNDNRILAFSPSNSLKPNTTYQIIISSEARGQNGANLEQPYKWSFITEGGMDVSLIIDKSGSVQSLIESYKRVALSALTMLDASKDRVTVVSFHDYARVLYPLGNDFSVAASAIQTIYSGGMTNIADGLLTAQQQFENNLISGQAKGHLILTDWMQTVGADYHPVLQQMATLDPPVYSITPIIDYQTKGELRASGGNWYQLIDLNSIGKVAISEMRKTGYVKTFEGILLQGEQKKENVFIDSSIKGVTFSLYSEMIGFDLKVFNPDGTQLDTDSPYRTKSEHWDVYYIDNPQKGLWRIEIQGKNINSMAKYDLNISAKTSIYLKPLGFLCGDINQTVNIEAQLMNDSKISDVKNVSFLLNRLDNSVLSFPLVYDSVRKTYTSSFIVTEKEQGDNTFRIRMEGTNVQGESITRETKGIFHGPRIPVESINIGEYTYINLLGYENHPEMATYGYGDTVDIEVCWWGRTYISTPIISASADFSNIDSNYSHGKEIVELSQDGSYARIRYTISKDNTRTPGNYVIPITATDQLGVTRTYNGFVAILGRKPFYKIQDLGYGECPMFGDYDNDGDLDIVAGSGQTIKIFQNNNGQFSVIQEVSIPGSISYRNGLLWVDYDNDGDLDIIGSGNEFVKVFKNINNTFTEDTNQNIAGLKENSIQVGDYDNDGDSDLVICGIKEMYGRTEPITKIYRNDNGIFKEDRTQRLTQIREGGFVFGDYDNDGNLDLALSGRTGIYPNTSIISKIYKNNNGSFVEDTAQQYLVAVAESPNVQWIDYDNDGKLDLSIKGYTTNENNTFNLYRNDNGIMKKVFGMGSSGETTNGFAWGDVDNDGDLDLIADKDIYYNDNGNFNRTQKITDTAGKWWADGNVENILSGDLDNDGNADLVLTDYGRLEVYRNCKKIYNSLPNPPTNLSTTYSNEQFVFTWNPISDVETPVNGLYYNIRIGTTPGGNEIISGKQSSPLTGNYLRPKISDTQLGVKLNLAGNTTYYWSVQTIDTALKTSEWSPEQAVYIQTDFTPPATRFEIGLPNKSYVVSAIIPQNDVTSVSTTIESYKGDYVYWGGPRIGIHTFDTYYTQGTDPLVILNFSPSGTPEFIPVHTESSPLVLTLSHEEGNAPFIIHQNDTITITYDNGKVLTVYLPYTELVPSQLGGTPQQQEFTLYVASDGSTYYDKEFTKVACLASGSQPHYFVTKNTPIRLFATDEQSEIKEIKYKIDAGDWQEYASSFTLADCLDGEQTVYFYSVDTGDNKEEVQTVKFTIDNTPPITELNISQPKYETLEKTYVTAQTEFVLKSTDALSGVKFTKYQVDNGNWFDYSKPFTFALAPEEGYVYIADYFNHRIIRTRIDGSEWSSFGTYGNGVGQFKYPKDIVYDAKTRYLYIVDSVNYRIVKTKFDGTGWTTLGSQGWGVGQFYALQSIVYDSNTDSIYVADYIKIVRTKIDGSGWQVFSPAGGPSERFNGLKGIYYDDSNGFIYATDAQNHRVVKTKIDGSEFTSFYGTPTNQFNYPSKITYDKKTGYFYIIDGSKIIKTQFDGTGWTELTGFYYPWDLFFDEYGRKLYISDMYYGGRIVQTDEDGVERKFLNVYAPSGIFFDAILLPEGFHTLNYYSEDMLNNTEETKTISVILDSTPPEIRISSPVGGERFVTKRDKINIDFTVTDLSPFSTTAYLILTECSDSSKTGTKLQVKNGDVLDPLDLQYSGSYVLTVNAEDVLGHTSSTSTAKFEVIIDTVPPLTVYSIGQPVRLKTQLQPALISNFESITTTINPYKGNLDYGRPYISYDVQSLYFSMVFDPDAKLDEFSYEPTEYIPQPLYLRFYFYRDTEDVPFIIQANDTVTITYDSGKTLTIYLPYIKLDPKPNNTPVGITLYIASDGSTCYDSELKQPAHLKPQKEYHCYITKNTPITLTSKDEEFEVKKTYYKIDEDVWQEYSSSFTLTNYSDGEHTLHFYSVDIGDNREEVKSIKFTIDNTPPTTELNISQPKYETPEKTYVTAQTKFTLVSTDTLSGVDFTEYQIDDSKWYRNDNVFALSVVSNEGSIYVVDTNNHRILRTNIDGTEFSSFGTYGTEGVGTFKNPQKIFYDSHTSFLYVTDAYNKRVVKTKFDGTGWTTLTSNLTGEKRFSCPLGIVYDHNTDYIFVADWPNKIVKTKIDGTGWQELNFIQGIGYLVGISGICYDNSTGFIYISDAYNHRIIKTKIDGSESSVFYGVGSDRFYHPRGILYDSKSRYLYIADSGNNRIIKTKFDGTGWIKLGSSGNGILQFNQPNDISYDPFNDRLYVVDKYNDRIVKTKIDGSEWQILQEFRWLWYPSGIYLYLKEYEGSHIISYYSQDELGNQESIKTSNVLLDNTAPEITISTTIAGRRYTATIDKININFAVSDLSPVGTTAYLTLVESPKSEVQGQKVYVKAGDKIEPLDLPYYGFYTLTVEATDCLGHYSSSTTAKFEVVWDTKPPRTAVVTGEPK
ncbi:MAG: FG-GAP-like repeat-containing protein, partial [Elusimicrobiota bacterium]